MSSKSSSHTLPMKRKITTPVTPVKHMKMEFTSQRHCDLSDDDVIRARLLSEGDQGSDDRRILTLMKTFHRTMTNRSSPETEKLFAALDSIEHSYHLIQSSLQMEEREQVAYTQKSQSMHDHVTQLRLELRQSEQRLKEVKQRRLNLQQYDQRTDVIKKFNTRKELKAQKVATVERRRYFEHLQQTFEATYQQRMKQIAVYMRSIFELEDILQQDAHEDGASEQPMSPSTSVLLSLPTIRIEKQRTYSDSSITSLDGDETISTIQSKNRNRLERISLATLLAKNDPPQALFSNEFEVYGTLLAHPLLFLSTSE